MSYHMPSIDTRAWHGAMACACLLRSPSPADGGCEAGAWEGSSEALARQGNSLALGRATFRSLLCCGLRSSPPAPLVLVNVHPDVRDPRMSTCTHTRP